MKNIQKIYFVFLVAALMLPVYSSADVQPAVPQLREYAQRLTKNFDDQEARAYFRELAQKDANLSESDKFKILRLSELLSYLDFLRQRLGNLKGAEVGAGEFSLAERKTAYPEYSLEDMVARLSLVKEELVEEIREKQLEHIQLKPKETASETGSEATSSVNQLEIVNGMRGEVKKLHESFKNLQDRMNKADQSIQHLTDDLAAKTLESFEKEQIIARQKQDLIDLEQKLSDAKERFTLGQQLLREKNDKLEKMEGSETVAAGGPGKDFEELKNKFAALQVQFDDQIKSNKARLSIVEGLLAEQEKRMAQYTVDLRAKGQQLDSLTNLVLEKSKQLSELNAVLASKDEKLLELGGIIQIYKEKLTESNKLLRERAQDVKALEDKAANEKQNMNYTQSNLNTVDEQLILLKEKLQELP